MCKIMLNLKNKTSKEKVQIKSKELAKVKLVKFKKGKLNIEIIGDIKEIEGGIELYAKAFKGKEQLGFGKDGTVEIERFRFFNPPILVPDENGDIISNNRLPVGDTGKTEVKETKFKYDPEQVIIQELIYVISQVAKDDKNIVKGKIGNTTSTFYSSIDMGVGLMTTTNRTWSTIRTTATGDTLNDAVNQEGIAWLTSSYLSDNWTRMARGMFLFDTSAIPDTNTISSATLTLTGAASYNSFSTYPGVALVSANPSSTSSFSTSDYNYTKYGTTRYATDKTSWNASGANNFALNSTGISAISKTGISKFGTRSKCDADNSPPNWEASKTFYAYSKFVEETGTSSDPKLVVVHAVPSSIKSINGLAKASIKSRNSLAIGSIKSINGLS